MITVKFGGVLYHFILGRQSPPFPGGIVHRVVPGNGKGIDTMEMNRLLLPCIGVRRAGTRGLQGIVGGRDVDGVDDGGDVGVREKAVPGVEAGNTSFKITMIATVIVISNDMICSHYVYHPRTT